MTNERQYLSPTELAAKSGLSLSTINRLKRERRIPYMQPTGPGGKALFPPDAMDQLMHRPEPTSKEDFTTGPKMLAGVKPAWQRLQKGN
ncbi:MAG: helix-turn-helix domain-containing protein [Pirellulaceae bacterium]